MEKLLGIRVFTETHSAGKSLQGFVWIQEMFGLQLANGATPGPFGPFFADATLTTFIPTQASYSRAFTANFRRMRLEEWRCSTSLSTAPISTFSR